MTTGDVQLTLLDSGGSVVVPLASVQVVFGCSSAGDAYVAQPVASRNPNTIQSLYGQGPLVEYACLCVAKGGTPLIVKTTANTDGAINGAASAALNIASSTNATPIVVTTSSPHGLKDGDVVTIAGHLVNTTAVGTWVVQATTTTTLTLIGSAGTGIGGATGTVQWTGSNVLDANGVTTAVGTSAIYATGTPYDTYYVEVLVTDAGTVGTTGIKFKVSLDGGRSYGPKIALGTATTYAIPDTGITLNFVTAKTLTLNSYARFSTVEPIWNTAGIQAGCNGIQASPYSLAGWGSMVLTGTISGSDATSVQGYLATLATEKIYTRLIAAARDSHVPIAWGGAGETEATWMTALLTDFSATNADRMAIAAGHYNMGSVVRKAAAGNPKYRRPLSYALGARQITIQPQKHAGRVKDGPLGDIAVDPINDPLDGFVYHDERLNPGLNEARFTAAKTRVKKGSAYWIDNPNLMSANGSIFTLLPLGLVMDIACDIVNQVGTTDINEDVRLNDNGTIFDNEAIAIEKRMGQALKDDMLAKNMISNFAVVVDRANNVLTTSQVNVSVTIVARGYILQENITIGYGALA